MGAQKDFKEIRANFCIYKGDIPDPFRYAAKRLIGYSMEIHSLPISKNRQTKAYTVCLVETARWAGLGSLFSLSDIPEEPRFSLLRLCLSQLVMEGLVENTKSETSKRRMMVMGTLADRLNSLFRVNAGSNKLHLTLNSQP